MFTYNAEQPREEWTNWYYFLFDNLYHIDFYLGSNSTYFQYKSYGNRKSICCFD